MIQNNDASTVCQERLLALYQQHLDQEYCDVAVKIEDETFYVHACILAASCPKLHKLIKAAPNKRKTKYRNPSTELCLSMFSPTSFLSLLPYFYTGVMNFDELSVADLKALQKAAKWCMFEEVVLKCANLIESKGQFTSISVESNENMLKCEVCNIKFEDSQLLQKHMFEDSCDKSTKLEVASLKSLVPQMDTSLPLPTSSDSAEIEDNNQSSVQSTIILQFSPDSETGYSLKERSNDDIGDVDEVSIVCEFMDDDIEIEPTRSRRKPRKSKPFRLEKKNTPKSRTPTKTWTCLLCPDEIFYRKRDQVVHVKENHGVIKAHACKYCDKDFTAASLLKTHMRTHTKERTDVCVECGKCFADKKTLKDHLRKHSGEKPFLCTECGKAFTFRQSLYRHMKFHQGQKMHNCDICGKGFVLKHNLREHVARHEKQSNISCKQCQMKFLTMEACSAHLKNCKMYLEE